MPSLLQTGLTLAPLAAGAINSVTANNSATAARTTGLNNAAGIVSANGTALQNLYDQNNAQNQAMYAPYTAGGPANVSMLNAGLQPGGGLADPYGKTFSFTGADLQNSPGYQFGLTQGQKQIDASRAAMGTRFSGGAVKKAIEYGTDYAGTKFNDAFNQSKATFDDNANLFETDQANRYNRLQSASNFGLQATQDAANANQNYATESAAGKTLTSEDLANLQIQHADALAAGDIGKAASIQSAIQAGVGALSTGSRLLGAAAPAADAAGKLTGGASLSSIAANAPDLGEAAAAAGGVPSTIAGAVLPGIGADIAAGGGGAAIAAGAPDLAAAAAAAGGVPSVTVASGAAADAAGATAGGGGLGAGVVSLLTNPVTIVAAAAIIGITALLKSQAHWEANTWVNGFQNKFDQNMGQINQQFFSLAQSGQLTKDQATAMRDSVQSAMTQYEAQREKFAGGGSDNKRVAGQALDTFNAAYGANGSKTLNSMDSVIAGLPS